MPRPIQYDIINVLDRALTAFWQHGFAACSIQILVEATGLSRQSLYSIFKDKDGLFREVLKLYRAKIEVQCRTLDDANADLMTLRSFIIEGLKVQRSVGSGACFIVITAFGPQALDSSIKPALDEGAARVRGAFEAVLIKVQRRGVLSTEVSPKAAADQLYAVMNGLSALQQTGSKHTEIETTLDLTIQALIQQGQKI